MFDHIIVPLDGSALAECVLPHAVAIARVFTAPLTLLRVVDEQAGDPAHSVDPLSWQIEKRQASAYLEQIAATIKPAGIETQSLLLEGRAAERIVEYVKTCNAHLVVLSSHGRSGISGWNISSIAQKILLRATGSTLLVRAYQSVPTDLLHFRYTRILAPLDGSLRAECVLPIAMALAQQHEAQLVALHVVNKPEMPRHTTLSEADAALSEQVVSRNSEEAQHYLEQLGTRMAIETHLLHSDNVLETVQEWVEHDGADLVILSAHGYSGRMRWPYGSVVTSMITYGSIPILIVQDAPVDMAIPTADAQTRRPESRPETAC
jgi:nucleotide-binding universal stress UspA family protein